MNNPFSFIMVMNCGSYFNKKKTISPKTLGRYILKMAIPIMYLQAIISVQHYFEFETLKSLTSVKQTDKSTVQRRYYAKY